MLLIKGWVYQALVCNPMTTFSVQTISFHVILCEEHFTDPGEKTPHHQQEAGQHSQLEFIERCEWREVLAEICKATL